MDRSIYTYEIPYIYKSSGDAYQAIEVARALIQSKGYETFQESVETPVNGDYNAYRASIDVWVDTPGERVVLTSSQTNLLQPKYVEEFQETPVQKASKASLISGLLIGGAAGVFLTALLSKLFGKKKNK